MLPTIVIFDIVSSANAIQTTFAGPDKKTGKFSGLITKNEGGKCITIVNTGPLFNNAEDAQNCTKEIVEFVLTGNDEEFKKAENWPHFQYLSQSEQERILDAQARHHCSS